MNKDEFLQLLPSVLQKDKKLCALALATADILDRQYEYISYDNVYGCIDALPESLLDILAKDFKIDWWNPNYTLEEKRATLKSSWKIHRKLGTRSAVIAGVSDIYSDTTIKEWFEYGGDPYNFKLVVNSNERMNDFDKLIAVINRVKYYKNVRSHFGKIEFRSTERVQRYIGLALQEGQVLHISNVPWGDEEDHVYLVDTDNRTLVAEDGTILFDDEN